MFREDGTSRARPRRARRDVLCFAVIWHRQGGYTRGGARGNEISGEGPSTLLTASFNYLYPAFEMSGIRVSPAEKSALYVLPSLMKDH